jgi:hypothetical protein
MNGRFYIACVLAVRLRPGSVARGFDNDGWRDLFIAQSRVVDNVEQIDPSLRYLEPPLLALNRQRRFERADSGFHTAVAGYGAAFGDPNSDGWIDVIMTALGGRPVVLRNRGGANEAKVETPRPSGTHELFDRVPKDRFLQTAEPENPC